MSMMKCPYSNCPSLIGDGLVCTTHGVRLLPFGPPVVEPSADQREGAKGLRQMWVALVEQGFTEHQACVIMGNWLANIPPQSPS